MRSFENPVSRLYPRDRRGVAALGCNLPASSGVSSQGMTDEARRRIQRRQYDDALEQLLNLFEDKIFRMAVMMLKDPGRAEEVDAGRLPEGLARAARLRRPGVGFNVGVH